MSDDRSKGRLHETDHARKHEGDFRVIARRNKLLGRWAARLMNLPRLEADANAKQVVTADLDEPGDDDVIRKIMDDFESSGVNISREELLAKMNELLDEARAQLQD
jgi:hypothetical protein